MSKFAERLKDLRDRKGHTQTEVGKALGKSREAVSKYEIGEREPDLEAVASLSRYFNVSADYILGISDEYSASVDSQRMSFIPEIYTYEKYLRDISFIPILNLAVKIKDHNLDLHKIENYINAMIKKLNPTKSP